MVEFALTALVFFMIVFGVIDLGRVVFEYNLISNSAREGARMAVMQNRTDAEVIAQAANTSAGMVSSDDVSISGSRVCTSIPCPSVTVTVQHTFVPATPLIGTIIGGSGTILLTASSTMVVER